MNKIDRQLFESDVCHKLAYGLKFYLKNKQVEEAVGFGILGGTHITTLAPFSSIAKSHKLKDCKPILIPITNISSRMVYKGKKILPIYELFKIVKNSLNIKITIKSKEIMYFGNHINGLKIISENDTYYFYYDHVRSEFTLIEWIDNKEPKQLTINNQFILFDWLDAHMFDFRGLIDKNLAISVNNDKLNDTYKNKV